MGNVTHKRALSADADTHNWLLHGRTFNEQLFSPLAQINDKNISKLGLAWHADIPSPDGLVSTPLIVDGVIYLTGSFANVFAINAETGKLIWHFDPVVEPDGSVPSSWISRVNRGVAVWDGKVFVGTGAAA